jgi:hypothetical protein
MLKLLLVSGRYEEASRLGEEAAQKFPIRHKVWVLWARARELMGNLSEAR